MPGSESSVGHKSLESFGQHLKEGNQFKSNKEYYQRRK
jgi:hypothetical protein